MLFIKFFAKDQKSLIIFISVKATLSLVDFEIILIIFAVEIKQEKKNHRHDCIFRMVSLLKYCEEKDFSGYFKGNHKTVSHLSKCLKRHFVVVNDKELLGKKIMYCHPKVWRL